MTKLLRRATLGALGFVLCAAAQAPVPALGDYYRGPDMAAFQNRHFMPERKPPPPLPLRPEEMMVSMTCSGVYSLRHF